MAIRNNKGGKQPFVVLASFVLIIIIVFPFIRLRPSAVGGFPDRNFCSVCVVFYGKLVCQKNHTDAHLYSVQKACKVPTCRLIFPDRIWNVSG